MTGKYLCIHGHFYQPPRENPWIDIIENQPSAKPFHDWNERITRECYTPNAWSRVLGQGGRVVRMINNYEYMSFNFGPTLLSWMEETHPKTYARLQQADRDSRKSRSGHGNAMAQVYNHIIMPLANQRDKITQVRWGKADFIHRFGRDPEGMWLAETAVDTDTLEVLAAEGIRFVVLAPDQAEAVRPLGEDDPESWEDVTGSRVDPRRAYRTLLPSGAAIDLFFYDGPVSRAIAYERLLASGSAFLDRIEMAFGDKNGGARLVNLATDGESYGHHFQFGDMALAWVFDTIEETGDIQITNYGEFLEISPPDMQARIVENSSWSCAHGVGRWSRDCGCHVGGEPGWTQAWRKPLRDGLNDLRDDLAGILEKEGGRIFKDPWAARNEYVNVLLDPSEQGKNAFLSGNLKRDYGDEDRALALRLMEIQLMSLYMFTSCGWFFDDISGLEPIQDLLYASRGIDLAEELSKKDLHSALVKTLETAKANDPDYEDGADIWRREVLPAKVDSLRIVAHLALSHLVDDTPGATYPVEDMAKPLRTRRFSAMGMTVLAGRAEVFDSRINRSESAAFLAFHGGGPDLFCLVDSAEIDLDDISEEVQDALESADSNRIREIFTKRLPSGQSFDLQDLVLDTRNRLVRRLARGFFDGLKAYVFDNYSRHRDVLALFRESGLPSPEEEEFLFRIVVSEELVRILNDGREPGRLDLAALRALAHRARIWGVEPTRPWLNYQINKFLRYRFEILAENPDQKSIKELSGFLRLARAARRELDLWDSQNRFDDLNDNPDFLAKLSDEQKDWFDRLGRELGMDLVKE